MSVLVTGGAGYIGSHMVHELRDSGQRLVVLDNLSTGHSWAIPGDVPLITGDICNQKLVASIIKDYVVKSIIHFAGSIVVPDSVTDPLGYYHNNTVKSRDLIACAVYNGVKNFIFSSTAAVYGMPEKSPISEQTSMSPISPYGSSKMMTEIMLRDCAAAHDFNYVALRYFNVAGADPKGRCGQSTPNATHLIKVAAQTALGQRPCLEVFGTDYPTPDGTCVRDYIHVCDLARAHSAALEYLRDGGKSRVLNAGYGRGFSVLEVIEAVKKISKADFKVQMSERRAGDPADLVSDARLLPELLGWKPEYDDLETIVEHAFEWE
ncbi:MAG: UDP-glucose 4-epimerase GalE, partial [Hyphomicrobiaceae bacterium]|nr:UDP-glucose 4-epimerase GalE [Hyphomicrobiaceae bacterium]